MFNNNHGLPKRERRAVIGARPSSNDDGLAGRKLGVGVRNRREQEGVTDGEIRMMMSGSEAEMRPMAIRHRVAMAQRSCRTLSPRARWRHK